MTAKLLKGLMAAASCWLGASAALAALAPDDRADPSVIEGGTRDAMQPPASSQAARTIKPAESASTVLPGLVPIGSVRVEGAVALPPSAFARVVEAYSGRSVGHEELKRLASEIADVARRAGYGLATAYIPQQKVVNGLLRVRIDEGGIDAIEAEGNAAAVVERALAPLTGGEPVRTADLERRLLLASDVSGVTVGKPRLVRRGERTILIVRATRDRVAGRASIDNWGTGAVGPVRLQLSADISGLLAEDDRLTVGGVLTPLQPREFGLVRAEYTKQIGSEGTEIALGGYIARTRPGGSLEEFDYEGRSAEASVSVRHPFARSRAASLWGEVELTVRDAEQTRDDVKVREDRVATVTASAIGSARFDESRVRGRLSIVQGLEVLGATEEGDPLASRADAGGGFTKVEAWGHFETPLGEGFSVQAQGEAQLASGPLLSSEEMGLGGRYFLRGYDYRQLSGDSGAAASLELRRDFGALIRPISSFQLYVYGDAGTVGNLDGGSGGGSLASAGGGLRLRIFDRIDAGAELGMPIGDEDENNPRLSFTLGSRF